MKNGKFINKDHKSNDPKIDNNIKWRKQIKVGSRVMWCGSWGRNPAEETTVESIEKTTEPHCKEGTAVDCIDFDERDCSVMVLTNGHWCYGDQIVDVLD